jgi:3-oxoadipate enol-lactonase
MEKISVNGITLAFERLGRGTPLVLIHGYPLDHSIWREVIPFLEPHFDMILPDLRGFGESTTIDSQYNLSMMADDLVSLLDHIGIETAVVTGHSMGGYVALAFAKKYQNRASGLVLISSQAAGDSPERKEERYKTADEVAQKGVEIVAHAMSLKLSANLNIQGFVKELILRQSKAGVIGALKAMAVREDATPFMSTFNLPTVLIHGDADVLIPIDRAREIKGENPRVRLVELPKIGHMPMMEAPQKTAEALQLLK